MKILVTYPNGSVEECVHESREGFLNEKFGMASVYDAFVENGGKIEWGTDVEFATSESTTSESTASESTTSESTASESTGGESTGGESTGGESTGGESTDPNPQP